MQCSFGLNTIFFFLSLQVLERLKKYRTQDTYDKSSPSDSCSTTIDVICMRPVV